MQKRTSARILRRGIIKNYEYIRGLLSPGCELMAVVKADAYGHGAAEVARLLASRGASRFAVASLEEALELREAGVGEEILILGSVFETDARLAAEYNLVVTVSGAKQALSLAGAAGDILRVHVKLDTGMSRSGIYCHNADDTSEAADECEKIYRSPLLSAEGIYTHFCVAETDPEFTERQFRRFTDVCSELQSRGICVGTRHCCNSAGILLYPQYHLDMVRAGIALYGYMPSPEMENPNLKKCMVLESSVSQVKDIKAGDTVGYARSFTAEHDMRIAVVSIGYGDGYSRLLSNKDSLLVNGRSARVLGKICMDSCMIDVSDVPCRAGDTVVVFGTDGKDADTVAEIMGTISYEVLCDVGKRVPRIYDDADV